MDRLDLRQNTKTESELLAVSPSSHADGLEEENGSFFDMIAVPHENLEITFFDEPFCPEDLAKVGRWKPLRDRVSMLAWSGLWIKVPPEEW